MTFEEMMKSFRLVSKALSDDGLRDARQNTMQMIDHLMASGVEFKHVQP